MTPFQGERSQDFNRIHELVRTVFFSSFGALLCMDPDDFGTALELVESKEGYNAMVCKRDCRKRLRMRETPSRD
jgi:hypothetical protein